MELAYQYNLDLYRCLPELDVFARLGPNTGVNKNPANGQFEITGGSYSSILGFQYASDLYNGRTVKSLCEDLEAFENKISGAMLNVLQVYQNTQDTDQKAFKERELCLAIKSIESALEGSVKDGGMKGLLITYQNDQNFGRLNNVIRKMEKLVSSEVFTPGYCPEKSFTDYEWDAAVETSRHLQPESTNFTQYYGNFCVALTYNEIRSFTDWNKWDPIITFDGKTIYLGGLPLKSSTRNDAEALKELGVEAVLSVTEVFEVRSEGSFTSTSSVTPDDWHELGIRQLQIPTSDFKTISIDKIRRAVEFMRWNMENGRSVYVHCKAGRGRSLLVILCFLVEHCKFTALNAYQLATKKRPQAGFGKDKMRTLLDYEQMIQKEQNRPRSEESAERELMVITESMIDPEINNLLDEFVLVDDIQSSSEEGLQ